MDNTTIEKLDDSICHKRESWGVSINIGNIQYGQNRDFFLKLSTQDGSKPSVQVLLKYNDLADNNNFITINNEQRFFDEYSENIILPTLCLNLKNFQKILVH